MTVVWITATLLQTLAARGQGKAGATFTSTELIDWLGSELTDQQRTTATSALCRLQYVKHQFRHGGPTGQESLYTVTAEGAAAINEAGQGHVHKSGPKGPTGPQKAPPPPDSLVMRLWKLVRMRGLVDSDSAAVTLCDAGDPVAFKRMQDSVAKYLRRWCQAGALAESARRVGAVGTSNGCKRYVLQDAWKSSAEPPRWHQVTKGRRDAA